MAESDPHFEHVPQHRQSRGSVMVKSSHAASVIPASQPYRALEPAEPSTIWTRFTHRYRFGKLILAGVGLTGVIAVVLLVLGTLDVFHNPRYQSIIGAGSIGQTKYPGDSWGTVSEGHFNLSGKGDGTYYDPGVGILSCGTSFTAQDMVVALDSFDYGDYVDPNESPVCGACIQITGPLGSAKATIQDKCPTCGRGSLDLSPAVFALVGNFNDGRIPVSWEPC